MNAISPPYPTKCPDGMIYNEEIRVTLCVYICKAIFMDYFNIFKNITCKKPVSFVPNGNPAKFEEFNRRSRSKHFGPCSWKFLGMHKRHTLASGSHLFRIVYTKKDFRRIIARLHKMSNTIEYLFDIIGDDFLTECVWLIF